MASTGAAGAQPVTDCLVVTVAVAPPADSTAVRAQ